MEPTTLPTGQRGRILALGVTLVVILALWLGLVAPIAGFYFDRSDRLAERQRVARHMQQLVASRQDLEARAAELGDDAPAFNILDGSSIPVATAALQGIAQDTAVGAGASLTSVESLPGENGDGYRRVGLKVALSTSWPVLIHFLQNLQQSDTPMAIDDLQIHGSTQTTQPGLPGQGTPADQQLFDAGFTIRAPATTDAPTQAEKPPAEPANDAAPADAAPADSAPADAGPPDAAPDAPAPDASGQDAPAPDAPNGDSAK